MTIPEQLARTVRIAVDDGRSESVSAYVSAALEHYGRAETLRELLDGWWSADPDGPPTESERASARAELGLSE